MKRRDFMSTCVFLSALSAPGGSLLGPAYSNTNQDVLDDILKIPNFCSHEHWGSISSIGEQPGGYTADFISGAFPKRKTTLVDVLIDPYISGNLRNAGITPTKIAAENRMVDIFELAQNSPKQSLQMLKTILTSQQFTGTYLCLREGFRFAYNIDINDLDNSRLLKLNKIIHSNYQNLFQWYSTLCKKAHLSNLIRPVHPEFFNSPFNSFSKEENSITSYVLRIDPLLDMWKDSSRKDKIAHITGIEPGDPKSWRTCLENLFQLVSTKGAVGIKQLQAYRRDLNFSHREDNSVKFGGALSKADVHIFKDWIVNECCKLAHDKNWPHQVHVGTHNLPHSNPLPLASLAKKYPNQKIVLLHCWPFLNESGYLAKQFKNIFIDTCWQPILNPKFLKKSLGLWLNYVPLSKITMGNDATSIEMAVGSSIIAKQTLTDTLTKFAKKRKIKDTKLLKVAADFIHNNAVNIYQIGKTFSM